MSIKLSSSPSLLTLSFWIDLCQNIKCTTLVIDDLNSTFDRFLVKERIGSFSLDFDKNKINHYIHKIYKYNELSIQFSLLKESDGALSKADKVQISYNHPRDKNLHTRGSFTIHKNGDFEEQPFSDDYSWTKDPDIQILQNKIDLKHKLSNL